MRTIQKTGKPWLYDAETGDIVGVKDPDGPNHWQGALIAAANARLAQI